MSAATKTRPRKLRIWLHFRHHTFKSGIQNRELANIHPYKEGMYHTAIGNTLCMQYSTCFMLKYVITFHKYSVAWI